MFLSQEEKSAMKLARLQALTEKSDAQVIENILNQEGDINYVIPDDSPYKITKPDLIGYTALHLSSKIDNVDLLKGLLNHGADFTKKNKEDQTILHMLIAKEKVFKEPITNSFVNAVLSAHVTSKNPSNPKNKDGLSHFHVACMTTNSTAVQFFIEHDVSLDEPVDMDSNFFPGYTPLHFAVMCTNFQIVELLIMYGANMHIQDKKGMTVLHILIKRKLEMYDSINDVMYEKGDAYKNLQKEIEENDKIMNMLMENMSLDNDCVDSIGLSNFHIACTLQDMTTAQHLVDQVTDLEHCVNMNSSLWPGYTALHFAAHVSIKTLKMLVRKGSNLAARDSKGLTPLDICFDRYSFNEVCSILSLNDNYAKLLLSDGKTNLLLLIYILADKNRLKRWLALSSENIDIHIPMDSHLWPGYTPLHLAVLLAEKKMYDDGEDDDDDEDDYEDEEAFYSKEEKIRKPRKEVDLETIRLLAREDPDLTMQDDRGRTAIHLAFRLGKITVVDKILQQSGEIPMVSDDEGLSHLHIACAAHKDNQLHKFDLKYLGVDLVYKGTSEISHSVRPGSTPLHVCLVFTEDEEDLEAKIQILLNNGAESSLKDAYGLTPIHRIMEMSTRFHCHGEATEQLFEDLYGDYVAEEYGLNHLHVACYEDNHKAVKWMIEVGANVNLAIKCPQQIDDNSLKFLSRHDKLTPLHISTESRTNMYKWLLKRGADVFAKRADGTTALDDKRVLDYFVSDVKKKVKLWKRMLQEFGWTKLHLACYSLESIKFEELVKAELKDVNARISSNSPVWKGWTPLHFFVQHIQTYEPVAEMDAREMSEILLKNGADVTLTDEQQNTPITMLYKQPVCDPKMKDHALLLLSYHKDYTVNPVNSQGLSHFHLACYLNDLDTVKKFLSHGVDVNRPVHPLADWHAGCSPLHLASEFQVIDLLLSHGGNVQMENVVGRNALTEVLKRFNWDENLVTKIIEYGVNINGTNFKGETPFEIAINRSGLTKEKLAFFIKRGFIVNSCNPSTGAGFLAAAIDHSHKDHKEVVLDTIMNEKLTTYFGRTILHHTVTGKNPRWSFSVEEFVALFKKLIKKGHHINERDDRGCTALHLAVKFLNETAVAGLLASGADVNAVDANGKTALNYLPILPEIWTAYPPYDSERESVSNIKRTVDAHMKKLNKKK